MSQMQSRNTEAQMQQRNGDGDHQVRSETTDFYDGDSMQMQRQQEEQGDDDVEAGLHTSGAVNDNGANGAKANGSGGPLGGLVTCFGELLIDFVPTEAGLSLAEAPTYNRAPGGAPANVAVCVARLGGSSAFVGKVGDDGFGHMLADILADNAVNIDGICYDANARTALAFVTLRADGEREFMFYRNPSADMLLREDELDAELIRRSAIFHYGSISLISEPCRSAHFAAMKIAKDAGCLLSYDANLRVQLWPSPSEARRWILSVWNDANIVKVSEEEVAFLCKTGSAVKSNGDANIDGDVDEIDIEALKLTEIEDADALQLLTPSMKLLLVTEGSKGCRYYTQRFHGRVKSFSVKPVDTTGAGDAFMGAVLTQIAAKPEVLEDEGELREAIAFANACGAIATTAKGAIPALPNRASVLKLLNQSNESSDRVLISN